jgi:Mg2+ and Co2+ transporter CorA
VIFHVVPGRVNKMQATIEDRIESLEKRDVERLKEIAVLEKELAYIRKCLDLPGPGSVRSVQ